MIMQMKNSMWCRVGLMGLGLSMGMSMTLKHEAHAWVENPSDQLLTQEKAVLSRVLQIKGNGTACSATWISTGVLLTAEHCKDVIEVDHSKKTNLIWVNRHGSSTAIEVPVLGLILPEPPKSALEKFLEDLGLVTLGKVNRQDFMVLGVDPRPLEEWALPTEPMLLANPTSGPIPAGQELLVAGYGIDRPRDMEVLASFTEEGMVYEGLKPLRPQIQEPEPMAKLGAAILTTVQTNQKHYDIQTEAERDVKVLTECSPTQMIFPGFRNSCRYVLKFEISRRKDGPMILSGDSGGPAFVKDPNGQWRLLGVASANSFVPEMKRATVYQYDWNGKRARTLKAKPDRSSDVSKISFLEGSVLINASVLKQMLKKDPTEPVGGEFSSQQILNGRIVGFHVNLRDPEIHKGLSEVLPLLQAGIQNALESGTSK
jgi:hypothetical protein